MKKTFLQLKSIFLVFFIILFTTLSLIPVCQAAKPMFKANYDKKNEEAQITLQVVLPKYSLTEENEWMVLRCDDRGAGYFIKKGEPELISFAYFISIPADSKVKKVIIKPVNKIINLIKPIKPIPEPVIIGYPPNPPIPDEEIYNSPAPYPQKDFDYTIAKQGTTTMLVLTVYPFKYIGKSQELIVSEYIEAVIFLSAKKWKPNRHPSNAVDKNLKGKLVNEEDSLFFQGGAK